MKNRYSRQERKLYNPPQDKPWIWLPTEILNSTAWQSMGINCRRLIDFLLIEHRNHAGRENGKLIATYNQLEKFGLTRSKINVAIKEAEFLGFIKYEQGSFYGETRKPNLYKLTFYGDLEGNYASNDWKRITAENVKERYEKMKKFQKTRKDFRKEFQKQVLDHAL